MSIVPRWILNGAPVDSYRGSPGHRPRLSMTARHLDAILRSMAAKKPTKPSVGDVFAFPLEDGRFGAARVLQMSGNSVIVVACGYVGARPPTLEAALGAPPVFDTVLEHLRAKVKPSVIVRSIDDPIPRSFKHLGCAAPSAKEKKLVCQSFSDWENVSATLLIQWLRQNDPKAADALSARWNEAWERRLAQHRKKETERKKTLTLDELGARRFLPRWTGRFSSTVLRKARAILRRQVADFAELGEGGGRPTPAQRQALIRRGVEAFKCPRRHRRSPDPHPRARGALRRLQRHRARLRVANPRRHHREVARLVNRRGRPRSDGDPRGRARSPVARSGLVVDPETVKPRGSRLPGLLTGSFGCAGRI